MQFEHFSVMLDECIDALAIRPDGIYVDGTAGGAGHSRAIASHLAQGRLICLDKDPDAVSVATERLAQYPQAKVIRSDFADMTAVLDREGVTQVDGVLLDLGVSSFQLDAAERGFSYQHDAPLDMRMSKQGMSARDLVNSSSVEDLARILREFGEEKFAFQIAKNIARARQEAPIETTGQLAQIVTHSMPAAARRDGNPCKRSFQAIRIAVNGEMDSLSRALDTVFDRLAIGGRFCIITFHSLEDRMVKQKFAQYARGCTCPPDFPVCVCGKLPRGKLVTRKAITPSEQELEQNRRSRSARLRVIEKIRA